MDRPRDGRWAAPGPAVQHIEHPACEHDRQNARRKTLQSQEWTAGTFLAPAHSQPRNQKQRLVAKDGRAPQEQVRPTSAECGLAAHRDREGECRQCSRRYVLPWEHSIEPEAGGESEPAGITEHATGAQTEHAAAAMVERAAHDGEEHDTTSPEAHHGGIEQGHRGRKMPCHSAPIRNANGGRIGKYRYSGSMTLPGYGSARETQRVARSDLLCSNFTAASSDSERIGIEEDEGDDTREQRATAARSHTNQLDRALPDGACANTGGSLPYTAVRARVVPAAHRASRVMQVSCVDMSVDRLVERLLFLGIIVLACLMPAQNDTWWHLRAGYEMLSHPARYDARRVLPHGLRAVWENHAWLSQVIFATAPPSGRSAAPDRRLRAGDHRGHVARLREHARESNPAAGACWRGSSPARPSRGPYARRSFTLLLLGGTIWLVSRERWIPSAVLFPALGKPPQRGRTWSGGPRGRRCGTRDRAPPRSHPARRRHRALCARDIADASGSRVLAEHRGIHAALASIRLRSGAGPTGRRRISRSGQPPQASPRSRLRAPAADDARDWGYVCGALMLLPVALASMRNISPFPDGGVARPGRSPQRSAHPRAGVTRLPIAHGLLHTAHLLGSIVAAALRGAGYVAATRRREWVGTRCHLGGRRHRELSGRTVQHVHRWRPHHLLRAEAARAAGQPAGSLSVALVQAEGEVERTGDYAALFEQYRINCAAVPPGSAHTRRLERDGWITAFRGRSVGSARTAPVTVRGRDRMARS